ncbi:MAG: C1 family peptidase [Xanthomonadaceae bacterium]|nr:C1 family peptidase [Xanthomonadaceae bacterium]
MTARPSATAIRALSWYGWIPDLPDQRDHLYAMVHAVPRKLPAKVDLRAQCPAIENQGQLGSCTANALAGALEFLERKQKQPVVDLSRLFIYYNERVIEHSIKQDAGAMLRDGIKTLAKQGVCTEKSWPYVIKRFAAKPAAACYAQAKKHIISSYQRLSTTQEMRACLASGYPFVFGFSVYESFESDAVAKTGTVPMPQNNERVLGGHAVCAVGYDDTAQRFIVRNSWGTQWGRKGYGTMPYAYLADRNLSDDFWTMRRLGG